MIEVQAVKRCNEQAKLFPSDGELDDRFGNSVSISGAPGNDIAIVGSPSDADNGANSGSAYIYRKSGGIWVEEAKLLASDGAIGDFFGRSVSISGAPGNEIAIVGADGDNHSGMNENGSAYIYRFNGAVWVEEDKLLASDTAPFDAFGDSVSIIGTLGNEVVIVGASGDGDNGLASGSVYIYRFNGVTWVEEQKLLASDGADFDSFGSFVSISGAPGNEVAIVGARDDDDNGAESGSVYIYRFNGATWNEEDKLLA
ncbi:MAG: FG-GAP repeat protein, partial [Planctomycetes bacterium]|nr:FG-GAP repeat protein [Planctomycetota bacterium]